MRVIGLDPGGTTGIVNCRTDDDGCHFAFEQMGPAEHHYSLFQHLSEFAPDVVVCEQFEWRPNRHENKEYGDRYVELISREYIGVAKLWCRTMQLPVVIQSAGEAKGFVKDENIKKLGLWQPGKKHSMDALRHVLYYLTKQSNGDPSRQRTELLRKGWK